MGAGFINLKWVVRPTVKYLISTVPKVLTFVNNKNLDHRVFGIISCTELFKLNQAGIDGVGEYRSQYRLSQSTRRYLIVFI